MITTDNEAYAAYPHHRQFFNKLWLAEYLGYKCGPAGYTPTDDLIPSEIVVRPIYNLSGMGVGSYHINIEIELSSRYLTTPIEAQDPRRARSDIVRTLPAGTFWCEKFEGQQLSTTLRWVVSKSGIGHWIPIDTFAAESVEWLQRDGQRQQFISYWKRAEYKHIEQLHMLDQLADVGLINVESIGGKIIEVHLRGSPDPVADEFIPIFKGQENRIVDLTRQGFTFVYAYDDADEQLPLPRIGFMVRDV